MEQMTPLRPVTALDMLIWTSVPKEELKVLALRRLGGDLLPLLPRKRMKYVALEQPLPVALHSVHNAGCSVLPRGSVVVFAVGVEWIGCLHLLVVVCGGVSDVCRSVAVCGQFNIIFSSSSNAVPLFLLFSSTIWPFLVIYECSGPRIRDLDDA